MNIFLKAPLRGAFKKIFDSKPIGIGITSLELPNGEISCQQRISSGNWVAINIAEGGKLPTCP
jgi:hypothetical protein